MSISKSVRFKIFHRDGFTCQYCGRRPPDVLLEVDHVHPRAHGGDNDELNLLTSCDDCNRGKSAKILTEARPKPNADLEYLRIQQETTEVRRFLAGRKEHAALEADVIAALIETWGTFIAKYYDVPEEVVFRRWFARNSPEEIEFAIRRTGSKDNAGKIKGGKTGLIQYISAILRNIRKEAEESKDG